MSRRASLLRVRGAVPASLSMTFLANCALAVFGVATSSIAARLLGVDGRGALAAIQVFPTFISLIGLLGMPDSVVYWLSRDPQRGRTYVASATAIAVVASTAAALIAIPAVPALLHEYPDAVVRGGVAYLITCPILAVFQVSQQSLRGVQAFLAWNVTRVAFTGSWLIALLVAAAAGNADAPKVTAIYILVLVVLAPLTVRVAQRRLTGERSVDRASARALLRFGLPSVGASLPQMLNLRLDQLMLTGLVSARDLGLYAAAAGWSWAVNPILQAIALVTFPSVAASDESERRERFLRASRIGFASAIVVAAVVGLATPLAMALLYGNDFRDAVPVAVVLVGAGSIFGWAYILEEGARGLGLPKLPLQAELTGLVVTIVILFGGVPTFGIIAAAVASVLGYATTLVVLILRLRSHESIRIGALVRLRRSDLGAILPARRG